MPPTKASISEPRAPYGRHSERDNALEHRVAGDGPDGALQAYEGESYYGRPALKPGHYKWLIAQYFTVGGIAGAAQILAQVADLVGSEEDRDVVRHGRYVALAGAAISPLLLIADLYTPQRWYNMMRIFRRSSPMSFGSWALAAFGTFSGLAAAAQVWEDLTGEPRAASLGRLFGIPAALMGVVMSYYTGILLSATSVPFWAAAPRLLPALFGTSSMSTAAATLTLTMQAAGSNEKAIERLEKVDVIAGATELALLVETDHRLQEQEVGEPLREGAGAAAYHAGALGLGVIVPLAIHGMQMLTGKKSKLASAAAAVSTLVGGFLLRSAVLFAGNESGQRPRDYLRFTQPGLRDEQGS